MRVRHREREIELNRHIERERNGKKESKKSRWFAEIYVVKSIDFTAYQEATMRNR